MEGTVSEGYWNGCEGARRVHLLPRFPRIELLSEAACEDYYRARLRKVSRAPKCLRSSTASRSAAGPDIR